VKEHSGDAVQISEDGQNLTVSHLPFTATLEVGAWIV
jgi:hypothetical protein